MQPLLEVRIDGHRGADLGAFEELHVHRSLDLHRREGLHLDGAGHQPAITRFGKGAIPASMGAGGQGEQEQTGEKGDQGLGHGGVQNGAARRRLPGFLPRRGAHALAEDGGCAAVW